MTIVLSLLAQILHIGLMLIAAPRLLHEQWGADAALIHQVVQALRRLL